MRYIIQRSKYEFIIVNITLFFFRKKKKRAGGGGGGGAFIRAGMFIMINMVVVETQCSVQNLQSSI